MDTKAAILIVDDDPHLTKTLSDIVRLKGYAPLAAAEGKTALDMLNGEMPAVALIDLKLPDMDGLEVMREIKKRSPSIECIVLTGYGSQASAIEAVNLGAYGYMQKPYDVEQLFLTIHRAIEKRKAEEALRESHQRYKELSDSITNVFFAMDKDLRYTYWNKASEDLTGISAKDAIGKSLYEIFPDGPETRRAERVYLDVLRTQQPQTFENEYQLRGKDYVFEISAYPTRDGLSVFVKDITERKQAEEALRKSEERYRKQFDEAMDAIFIADAETGIIVDCNRVALELVDREKSELVGQHQRILHPPEEIEGEFSRTFKQHLQKKEGQVLEAQAITKEGEIKDVAIKASVFELEGQKMILGIFRDITERKRMEKTLRENEENFRAVAENANEGILVAVGEGAHVYVNKRAAEITGYSMAELLETDMKGLVHPDEFEKIMERYKKRLAGKPVPTRYQTIFIRKDGKSVPVEFAAAKTIWQGEPASVVFFQDITERKQAEEALRESEERYRNVVERANDGILIIQDTIIRYANPRLAEMWGGTVQEFIGTPFTDYVHPDELPKLADRYKRRMAGQDVTPIYETVLRRKDGSKLYAELNAGIITYQGKPADLVIVRDITERKQMEDALRAEKALMDALMDNIPDSIYFKDRQCRLTRINRNMTRSLGLKKMSQALGKTDVDLYGEEFGQKTLVDDQRILTTGEPIIGLVESRPLENGQINWTSTTKIPLRDASGQIMGLVGVTREINEVKQAEEEVQKRLGEITALHRVSEIINATLDLKELFQRVVEELSKTFGYPLLGIYLLEGDRLRLGAQIGYDTQREAEFISIDQGVVGRVVRTGQPAFLHDVTQDPGYVPDMPETTTEICVPIRSGQNILGVLNVESDDRRPLTDHDLQLLSILGSHIGVAIENARLYGETRKRLTETTVLHKVAEIINATLDLKEVFQRVVEELSSTFGYRLADMYLLEKDGLRLQANVGYDAETTIDFMPLERGVLGRVARTGQPAFIHDVRQDHDYIGSYPDITCEICVPVMSGGTTLGTLNVESDDKRPLTDHDLQLLSILGSHIGVAIENARLYEHSKKRVEELSGLYDISQAFSSMTDVQETFGELTKRIAQLIGCQMCFIATYDQQAREMQAEPPGYGLSDELVRSLHYKVDGPVRDSWNFRLQGPLLANDRAQIPDFFSRWTQNYGLFNLLIVPLSIEGRITGLAYAANKPSGFAQDDTRLLTMFANQVAIVIENARLYDETQRHLKEMTTLQRIGMELTSSLDLSSLLQVIADSTLELTNADYLHLFALDPDTGEFTQRAASWRPEAQEPPITWPRKNKGLTAAVLEAKEPVIIEKATDSHIYATPKSRKWGVKSAAGFPLKGKWGVTGVLNLVFLQPHTFSQDELDLLALLADQAAITIENARLYEKTQQLAVTDGLTGLYNLRYFYETLEKEIQRSERYHRPVSLIILDIDSFKVYNDRYGHLAGDDLLKELAQLMSKVTRQTDTLARYGGEEFTIILPETDTEQAIFLAQRLQEEVMEHRFTIQDGQTIGQITISLGVATYPHHAHSAKALVDAADQAMLRAKRAGKNQVAVSREALTELEPL